MRMTDETIKEINAAVEGCDLNVQNSLGGTSIYNKDWEICKLQNLTEMIDNLTKMRDYIESCTGIRF